MASAPIAMLGWSSVLGDHDAPPSVLFHIPPFTVPMYTLLGRVESTADLVGSTAMLRTRPVTAGKGPCGSGPGNIGAATTGAGPSGVQFVPPETGFEYNSMGPLVDPFRNLLIELALAAPTPGGT